MSIHQTDDFAGTRLSKTKELADSGPLAARAEAPAHDGPLAIIRQRSRTPGRAGLRALSQWYIEFEPWAPRKIEPLMGWTSSRDPYSDIRLDFPSLKSAVLFAESRGWRYSIIDRPAILQHRNYQSELARQRTLRRPAIPLVQDAELK
jgi:hypothetical protein